MIASPWSESTQDGRDYRQVAFINCRCLGFLFPPVQISICGKRRKIENNFVWVCLCACYAFLSVEGVIDLFESCWLGCLTCMNRWVCVLSGAPLRSHKCLFHVSFNKIRPSVVDGRVCRRREDLWCKQRTVTLTVCVARKLLTTDLYRKLSVHTYPLLNLFPCYYHPCVCFNYMEYTSSTNLMEPHVCPWTWKMLQRNTSGCFKVNMKIKVGPVYFLMQIPKACLTKQILNGCWVWV